MTQQDRALFHARTADLYARHKRWAERHGTCLPYDLFDLRGLAGTRLGPEACPYCRGPVTVVNFVVGHQTPIDRGGKFTLRNLAVCCPACAAAKGPLDDHEFREVCQLFRHWPRPVVQHFLARLTAGAAVVRDRLPGPGSLEWFTGAEGPFPVVIRTKRQTRLTRDLRGELRHEVLDGDATLGLVAGARDYQI
jgi:hypothetical protein